MKLEWGTRLPINLLHIDWFALEVTGPISLSLWPPRLAVLSFLIDGVIIIMILISYFKTGSWDKNVYRPPSCHLPVRPLYTRYPRIRLPLNIFPPFNIECPLLSELVSFIVLPYSHIRNTNGPSGKAAATDKRRPGPTWAINHFGNCFGISRHNS